MLTNLIYYIILPNKSINNDISGYGVARVLGREVKSCLSLLLTVFYPSVHIIDHLARLVNSRGPVHSEECPP
jgi:hypothetical protein